MWLRAIPRRLSANRCPVRELPGGAGSVAVRVELLGVSGWLGACFALLANLSRRPVQLLDVEMAGVSGITRPQQGLDRLVQVRVSDPAQRFWRRVQLQPVFQGRFHRIEVA